ncbi:MAG: twin-arginine translocase TatA/TatE family subunit [Flavobacteriales bacterium]|nr:Sec-independent protein translocase protein TatB [Flavobacteriales bacterium]MCC6577872.1 twin-arginine translocase TatA/TatE family subunit [Flavobacteriales bacterium]NUQ14748.1 twin-arginine translocase TatA/TatE family subunit [Flavobacteriales bacterium]
MGVFLLFDISGGELIVILLFVLLFFGAKGIPDIARTAGRAMRQLRDATDDVQREIRKGASEVRREVEAQQRAFDARPVEGSTAQRPELPTPPAPPAEPPAGT